MESKVVVIWWGLATSQAMMSSYAFVWMLGRPRRRAISRFAFAAASRCARWGSRSFHRGCMQRKVMPTVATPASNSNRSCSCLLAPSSIV